VSETLRRTPLFDAHVALGARMVPFAGFEMPVQYKSVVDEHVATRTAAGLFDVSHMGEVLFEGPGALASLQRLTTNDLAACADGQAQYNCMLRPDGGIIDDIVVYRFSAEKLFVCINAANRAKDVAWLKAEGTRPGCTVTDVGDAWAQIALQGPKAAAIVRGLTNTDVDAIKTYWFTEAKVAGFDVILARTGYTGEDGFELFCRPDDATALWNAMLAAGAPHGLVPAGLGARDSLRLEVAYRLYGNDMDETTTPLEAGLGWIVRLDKGEFVGRDVLVAQKAAGLKRRLVGFRVTGKGIARHDYPVVQGGGKVGHVTSGTLTPTVKLAVGLAYLPTALAKEGTAFDIEVRGQPVSAVVVKTPFYKRPVAG
jgi:aminomethyltransferase